MYAQSNKQVHTMLKKAYHHQINLSVCISIPESLNLESAVTLRYWHTGSETFYVNQQRLVWLANFVSLLE